MMIDLLSGVAVALPLVLILRAIIRKNEPKKYWLIILYTLYIGEVYDIVGIPAAKYMSLQFIYNFIPFHDYGQPGFIFQICMNAVLFMPLGFFAPLIWGRYRSFRRTLLAGFLTSMMIEVVQIFCFRATDIDDLLMNTLGCAIGYGISKLIFRRKWETAEAKTPAKDLWEFIMLHGIMMLVIIFVRTPISTAIYSLPMFR